MVFRTITHKEQVTRGGGSNLWKVFFKGQRNYALLPQQTVDVYEHEEKLMAAGFTRKQLKLIKKYGELRHLEGRFEVHQDWAEADAGEDF